MVILIMYLLGIILIVLIIGIVIDTIALKRIEAEEIKEFKLPKQLHDTALHELTAADRHRVYRIIRYLCIIDYFKEDDSIKKAVKDDYIIQYLDSVFEIIKEFK